MDPAACDLVEQGRRHRLDDARMIVDRLRALGALSSELTSGEAVDLVWLATDPALFRSAGPGAWLVPQAIREVAVAIFDRATAQYRSRRYVTGYKQAAQATRPPIDDVIGLHREFVCSEHELDPGVLPRLSG